MWLCRLSNKYYKLYIELETLQTKRTACYTIHILHYTVQTTGNFTNYFYNQVHSTHFTNFTNVLNIKTTCITNYMWLCRLHNKYYKLYIMNYEPYKTNTLQI